MINLENKSRLNSFPFQEGFFGDQLLTHRASYVLNHDGVIAMQMRGVFGMWGDATKEKALDRIRMIKGQGKNKPFSTMMPIADIWKYVDLEGIDPVFERFFTSPEIFSETFGGIMHACIPLKQDVLERDNFPKSIYSVNDHGRDPVVFNLDPTGHTLITNSINAFKESGIPLIAVTTLNRHNEKEISEIGRARQFINKANKNNDGLGMVLPVFLKDPSANPDFPGSFAQIDTRRGRVGVLREGNIASQVIGRMIGIGALRADGAKPYMFGRSDAYAKTTQSIIAMAQDPSITPQQMRKEILSRIHIPRV